MTTFLLLCWSNFCCQTALSRRDILLWWSVFHTVFLNVFHSTYCSNPLQPGLSVLMAKVQVNQLLDLATVHLTMVKEPSMLCFPGVVIKNFHDS